MALPGRRDARAARGCTKTASSPPPTAAPASPTRRYVPLAEPRDARYPFSLNTGRLRDQWHGMSRTGTLGRLFGHVAEPAVEMHPQDMARLRLADGDLVHVTSRRGSLVLPAQASDADARRRRPSSRCTGARSSCRGRSAHRRAHGRRQRADHAGLLPAARSSPS